MAGVRGLAVKVMAMWVRVTARPLSTPSRVASPKWRPGTGRQVLGEEQEPGPLARPQVGPLRPPCSHSRGLALLGRLWAEHSPCSRSVLGSASPAPTLGDEEIGAGRGQVTGHTQGAPQSGDQNSDPRGPLLHDLPGHVLPPWPLLCSSLPHVLPRPRGTVGAATQHFLF